MSGCLLRDFRALLHRISGSLWFASLPASPHTAAHRFRPLFFLDLPGEPTLTTRPLNNADHCMHQLDLVSWTILPDTPVGPLRLTGLGEGLLRLEFSTQIDRICFAPLPADCLRCDAEFADAIRQLTLYFAGRLREFTLRLLPRGTVFQQKVWQQLQQVPWGTTASYGELARAIGQPTACRAVGLANSRNPLPILIPCHRIIGRQRSLTGYNGGLDRKRVLLQLEGFRGTSQLWR